ncbi:MAG: BrnT family toxin [Syntrophorhabdus sp.]|nr:BrnT family toxin [Syntrophorhabdus sp.]
MMEFEFDRRKSLRNREKHGIDFVEAQLVWEDPDRIEVPARTEDEARYLVVGMIEDKHWSVVITYRGAKTRVISARRARKEEKQLYESQRF